MVATRDMAMLPRGWHRRVLGASYVPDTVSRGTYSSDDRTCGHNDPTQLEQVSAMASMDVSGSCCDFALPVAREYASSTYVWKLPSCRTVRCEAS